MQLLWNRCRFVEGEEGAQRLQLDPLEKVRLRFGRDDGKELSWVYESGRVLRRDDSDGFITVDAELPHSLATRLQKHRTLLDVPPQ